MVHSQLIPRHTPSARVEKLSDASHYRLYIPAGSADSYRLAQLDDYSNLPRKKFPHHTLTLSLRARTSSPSPAGTWGFGLWNDPFGLSLGFGGRPLRLPTLPNAAWFFGASQENYLSFRGNTGRDHPAPTTPANGFIAQTFRSPKFHPLLILAGLALPFSRKVTRKMLSRVSAEDGIQLWSPMIRQRMQEQAPALQRQSFSVDSTQWHRYRLEWSAKRVVWEVDEVRVFESAVSPHPPLGLVIWLDNQYAAFTPEGKISMGVLANEPAWLEVKDIAIQTCEI